MKPLVVLGLLGTNLDGGTGPKRWERWRPTVSIFGREDVLVRRLELLHTAPYTKLARAVCDDIAALSPETGLNTHEVAMPDPWDFEAVYGALHDFVRQYPFAPDDEDYLVHITTGTHVAQICWFLLVEAGFLPARLLQTSPGDGAPMQVIDLDLARYDQIRTRFERRREEAAGALKSGIPTRNMAFNALIARVERVATASAAPILLTGPTGAGKTQLARRIYDLKKGRRQLAGPLVEVNCATLRGDAAMSTLFGHVRGAYTGASEARRGLLVAADKGLLFLDEVAELGLDEQAMLLRAIEERRFLPLGADKEVASDFQLVVGTHQDLPARVRDGRFREDLLARIDLWTFRLPGLAERPEDVAPNLDYELDAHAARTGRQIRFHREARDRFLAFAERAPWPANFRELNAAVTRMATLAVDGRIDVAGVDEEIARLRASWGEAPAVVDRVTALLGEAPLDRFDRAQLADVLEVCASCSSLSEAGRALFAVSRAQKTSSNDADRLRKYLARFGLTWASVSG